MTTPASAIACGLETLEAALTRDFGPLIGGARLTRALGYSSQAAFRQAVARHRLPVKIFAIAGRRGKFALTSDVAAWLHSICRSAADTAPEGSAMS